MKTKLGKMSKNVVLVIALSILFAGCHISQDYDTNDSTGVQLSSDATASSIDQTKNSNSKNETELYNFRTSNWGDSKEDVLNHEKETQLKQTGPSLTGNVMVYGLDSFVTYNFNSDQLVRGIYMFYLDYSDTKEYISKYDELKNTVSQLYGDPIYDRIAPLVEESIIDGEEDTESLSLGHVFYITQWETETTSITLGMNSTNNKITVTLGYEDINNK